MEGWTGLEMGVRSRVFWRRMLDRSKVLGLRTCKNLEVVVSKARRIIPDAEKVCLASSAGAEYRYTWNKLDGVCIRTYMR